MTTETIRETLEQALGVPTDGAGPVCPQCGMRATLVDGRWKWVCECCARLARPRAASTVGIVEPPADPEES